MALKREGGLSAGRGGGWPGPASFAGLQVVLSVLLLALGAIFARSLLHIIQEDLGFDAAHTVIAAVHPYPRPAE